MPAKLRYGDRESTFLYYWQNLFKAKKTAHIKTLQIANKLRFFWYPR